MPGDLRQSALRGVIWSLVQAWGVRLMTLAHFVLIARFLEPADLGIIAFATAVVGCFGTLVDQGMGPQIESSPHADPQALDTAWWTSVVTALVVTGLIAASGPVLADKLDKPYLRSLLPALAVTVLLSAFSCVQVAVLKARFLHKSIAMTALVSTAVGSVVGLTAAWLGWAYWALVAKALVEALVTSVLVALACPWRPGLRWSAARWRAMLSQGSSVIGMRVLDIVNQRLDALLVGARLGPSALGFYSTGQRLYQIAMEALFSAVNQVSLPMFGRVSAQPSQAGVLLLRVVRLTSLVTVPAFGLAAAVAEPLITLMFGERWAGAAPVFAVFSLGGMLFSVSYFNAPLLIACGRSRDALVLTLLNAGTNALAFWLAVPFGPVAVAAAFVVRGYLVYPFNLYFLKNATGLTLRAYGSAVWPAVAGGMVAMAVGAGVLQCLHVLPRFAELVVSLAAGGLSYLLVLRFVFAHAWSNAFGELKRLRAPNIP